jgi:hypothetical protein
MHRVRPQGRDATAPRFLHLLFQDVLSKSASARVRDYFQNFFVGLLELAVYPVLISHMGFAPIGAWIGLTYSDTQIDAEVSTEILEDGMMFFGRVSNGRAALRINRLTGVAAYALNLLPHGAEAGMGPCHEVAAPGAKF